jgi:Uma2 family endonuclease
MAQMAPPRTTLQQFLALPNDDGARLELVHGWLVREPLPGPRHGRIAATLAGLLWRYAEAHGTGVVLTCDTGFLLHRSPDTVRGPDVALVSRARYEALDESAALIPGAPDLAVEVLSPTNRPGDAHAKVADYLAAGATLVWVVDPQREIVVSYRQLLSPEVLGGDDRLAAEDLLPGFAVPVREVFARR